MALVDVFAKELVWEWVFYPVNALVPPSIDPAIVSRMKLAGWITEVDDTTLPDPVPEGRVTTSNTPNFIAPETRPNPEFLERSQWRVDELTRMLAEAQEELSMLQSLETDYDNRGV